MSSAAMKAGAVATRTIADGAITSAKIAGAAVGATQLDAGAAAANLNASGLSGVASGGLVLSATENNAALMSAGYIKIGATIMSDAWLRRDRVAPPAARQYHTAVWTGSEMIVWGGAGGIFRNDGGRYDPSSNSWRLIVSTLPNTPVARYEHAAVWTGSEMIVWGGAYGILSFNDGGCYHPGTNSWKAVSPSAPPARYNHTSVWTGSERRLRAPITQRCGPEAR